MPGSAERAGAPHERLADLKQRLRSFERKRPASRRGLLSTGLFSLDQALGGGIATGEMTEIVGQGSCGRTALALAIVAHVTSCRVAKEGPDSKETRASKKQAALKSSRVAWIDPEDRLDITSAEASGVHMEHFLWMRGSGKDALKQSFKAVDLLLEAGGFSVIVLDLVESSHRKHLERSAWWVRMARKLENKNTALLVLSGEPKAFQPACRLICEAKEEFAASLSLRVMRRGGGEVQWMHLIHLRRLLK